MFNLTAPAYGPLAYGIYECTLGMFDEVQNDKGGYLSIPFNIDSRPGEASRKLTFFPTNEWLFNNAVDAIVSQHPQFLGMTKAAVLVAVVGHKVQISYTSSIDSEGVKHNNFTILLNPAANPSIVTTPASIVTPPKQRRKV